MGKKMILYKKECKYQLNWMLLSDSTKVERKKTNTKKLSDCLNYHSYHLYLR